jgi:multiple sugar transport system substrate-binding protein
MDDQVERDALKAGNRITRREVLKNGLIGAAGLAFLPAVIAACGNSTPMPPPTPTPTTGPASPKAPTATASLSGKVTVGSFNLDGVPSTALAGAVAAFRALNPGVAVTVDAVDHTMFQMRIDDYLPAAPQDLVSWFPGYRTREFAGKGLLTPIDAVWAGPMGKLYTDAFKTACTANDGHLYTVPWTTYAWTMYYVPSLWQGKGYTIPTTLDELKTLAARMKSDGLVPIGFGDKDGWPAMGYFDIIDLRENGNQFHLDLLAGKEKWTDPRVVQVFKVWKTLLPYCQSGAISRVWQDAATGLAQGTTGMMFQPQVVETVATAGSPALADLDMFPWPHHGTEWDAEEALDAPMDGWMLTSKSPTLAADEANARALLAFLGQGSAQMLYAQGNRESICPANDADTSRYTPLQKRQAQIIAKAKKITQFLDRDTAPGFGAPQLFGSFLADFLSNPDQDLNVFLAKIQNFWDAL